MEILDAVASRGAKLQQRPAEQGAEHLAPAMPRQHQAMLSDARKESATTHEGHSNTTEPAEAKTGSAHSSIQQRADRPDARATPQQYIYICPHCTTSVQSTVATGQVDHRRGDGCGKNFALLMACSQAAHIRTHVPHAARWCTQRMLPAEFK
jgi:hypothetical protein